MPNQNANFINNKATGTDSWGGAVYFNSAGNVINCNFADNTAEYSGAIYCDGQVDILNCNFNGNEANIGSALYLGQEDTTKVNVISHSSFLNNKADMGHEAFESTMNGSNLEITFIGNDNLLNAIYSRNDKVSLTNVFIGGKRN